MLSQNICLDISAPVVSGVRPSIPRQLQLLSAANGVLQLKGSQHPSSLHCGGESLSAWRPLFSMRSSAELCRSYLETYDDIVFLLFDRSNFQVGSLYGSLMGDCPPTNYRTHR